MAGDRFGTAEAYRDRFREWAESEEGETALADAIRNGEQEASRGEAEMRELMELDHDSLSRPVTF